MGILRTDKISGLETPTPVTGSVSFDGNDNLSIGNAGDFNFLHNALSDWTAEFWVKTGSATRQFAFGTGASSAQVGFSIVVMSTDDNQADGTGVFAMFGRGSAGNYRYWGSNGGLTVNTWHHIAAVFKFSDKTLTLYVDGVEVDSGTGTANGSFGTGDYSTSDSSYAFLVAKNEHSDTYLTGEISNLRVVDGRRLYTSDFTPPVHALETINGTRILCCNNPDSVTAVSNAGIGTAHIATTGGDPTVATDNPSLTRDFTFGTEFNGVTTFDTQGYLVPPSGTTTDRNRTGGRGLFAGGSAPSKTNLIDFINISSSGIAASFGDLTVKRKELGGCASATRGVFAGGSSTGESPTPPLSRSNVIDYVTLASEGNAADFGDLIDFQDMIHCGLSNSTRGIFAGGEAPSAPSGSNVIQYVTIAALGNAQDFGDLIRGAREGTGCASPTRGIIFGNGLGELQYITISTLGNAIDFGDHIFNSLAASCSDSTRGLIGGGTSPTLNTIQYITIATTGNAQDFGDLTVARSALAAVSNSIRGVFAGGSAEGNTIDYIIIQTTGNAVDWGDLPTEENQREQASASDSHGGIS